MSQKQYKFSGDFLEKDAISTLEKELEVCMLMEQYHATMTENVALKDEVSEREEWLCTFLELSNGIPDSDIVRCLFERLNPAELSECLNDRLEIVRDKRSVVAVAGKTSEQAEMLPTKHIMW